MTSLNKVQWIRTRKKEVRRKKRKEIVKIVKAKTALIRRRKTRESLLALRR